MYVNDALLKYCKFYIGNRVESYLAKVKLERTHVMQSYPPRVLDRRLQEDWARATKEGLGVLMNLGVDF